MCFEFLLSTNKQTAKVYAQNCGNSVEWKLKILVDLQQQYKPQHQQPKLIKFFSSFNEISATILS